MAGGFFSRCCASMCFACAWPVRVPLDVRGFFLRVLRLSSHLTSGWPLKSVAKLRKSVALRNETPLGRPVNYPTLGYFAFFFFCSGKTDKEYSSHCFVETVEGCIFPPSISLCKTLYGQLYENSALV